MNITRTKGEIRDMLRRVTFAMDATPERDLFGVGMTAKIEQMDVHRKLLERTLNDVEMTHPPILFDVLEMHIWHMEQTCWAWLCGEEWGRYPEMTKDEEDIWHTI